MCLNILTSDNPYTLDISKYKFLLNIDGKGYSKQCSAKYNATTKNNTLKRKIEQYEARWSKFHMHSSILS